MKAVKTIAVPCDFSLPRRRSWELRSSGILRNA